MDEKLEKYFESIIERLDEFEEFYYYNEIRGITEKPEAIALVREIYLAGCHAQSIADREAVKKLKLYPMLMRGERYNFITMGEVVYALEAVEIKEKK